jgi:hypothetical protein
LEVSQYQPSQYTSEPQQWYWPQKKTWRPVEQTRRPGYEYLQLCLPDFWQRHPQRTMEKRQPLQQMLLGKLGICLQKTEPRFMSFTLYKCQLKVD